MPKPSEPQRHEQEDNAPLKGTFVSVMLLGAFLIVSWIAVFVLFLARS